MNSAHDLLVCPVSRHWAELDFDVTNDLWNNQFSLLIIEVTSLWMVHHLNDSRYGNSWVGNFAKKIHRITGLVFYS